MVNYYKLLEIPQNADRSTIEQAIRKTRRTWNNRSNSPDGAIRAEAEQHVREIAEAEKILLNDAKRAEYDIQLAQSPKDVDAPRQTVADVDWEDAFFQSYEQHLYDFAAQTAYKAISANSQDGRAWFLYGEALRSGGDLSHGIDALRRASTILLRDDQVFRQLGFALYDANRCGEAVIAFQTASRLAPNNSEYHCLCSSCLRDLGRMSDAVTEAQLAYQISPDSDSVKADLFFALYEDALSSVSYNRSSGKHLITNRRQLDYVNSHLKTMSEIIPQGSEKSKCMSCMEELVKIETDAENIKGAGLFKSGKPGYEYNYETSNADTRASGLQ